MNKKRLLAYGLIFLLLAASVFVLFHPLWLQDLPDLPIFEGELAFSGERAFEDLKFLTENYPNRVVGSENAKASALWVEERLKDLGMVTKIEEFACKSSMLGSGKEMPNPFTLSKKDMMTTVKGYNVIGTLVGKKKDIILIGAHRDIFGSEFGAEDNGSGTVTMLELARILSREENEYTYLFVSFDGEEVGLFGSENFASRHGNLPIRLAVVLDMTGYKDADTVGFYQYTSGRGASPLWTVALAESILKSKGWTPYYFGESEAAELKPLPLLSRLISQRVLGHVNTDSGPFVDRSIPAIGIMAAKQGEVISGTGSEGRRIHTSGDDMTQISAETLNKIGKFAEQYIKSLSFDDYEGLLNSTFYLTAKGRFLGPWNLYAFIGLFIAAAVGFLLLSYREAGMTPKRLAAFFGEEKFVLLGLLALVLFASGASYLLNLRPFDELPIIIVMPLQFLIGVGGVIVLTVARFFWAFKAGFDYGKKTGEQRVFLNLLYTALFLILAAAFHPLTAVYVLFLPVLLMGRVSYRTVAARILWILVLAAWLIAQIIIGLIGSSAFALSNTPFETFLYWFLNEALWAYNFVYVVSVPRMNREKGEEVL